jgi:multidrug resistance efflux pump
MLNQRRAAAEKVAQRLAAAEAAIDRALTCAAELNAALPSARAEAGISAVVGQEALDGAADVYSRLVAARRSIVETHRKLDETKTQIGLRTVAIGDGLDKPDPIRPSGEADRPLRMVK